MVGNHYYLLYSLQNYNDTWLQQIGSNRYAESPLATCASGRNIFRAKGVQTLKHSTTKGIKSDPIFSQGPTTYSCQMLLILSYIPLQPPHAALEAEEENKGRLSVQGDLDIKTSCSCILVFLWNSKMVL